jgi:hypothetical protein
MFWDGVYFGLTLCLLFVLLVQYVFFPFLNKRKGIPTTYSLDEANQRRRQAAELLYNKYGIVVHQYWMPTETMLNDLGIQDRTAELYWAINAFDGKCFVLTDKQGQQWGRMIPLIDIKKRTRQGKLRIVSKR